MMTRHLGKFLGTLDDDDPTVDELMEALGHSSHQPSAFSRGGYVENPVETDQKENSEDLIAPEVLFPDEASPRS